MSPNFKRLANFISLSALILTGCGRVDSTQSRSSIKVTNGSSLSESDPRFLAVVLLSLDEGSGLCTGTFISQQMVLTARHCISGKAPPAVGGIESIKVLTTSGEYQPEKDIALVIFPEGTAGKLGIKVFPKLSSEPARKDETVTLIGYGLNNMVKKEGAGKKRIGTNVVTAVERGFIAFDAKSYGTGTGENAGLGSGDSGGPLLNSKGEILGVGIIASLEQAKGLLGFFGFLSDNMIAVYVDIHSASSHQFFTEAAENI